MSEYVRTIEITVKVDTNKQTYAHLIDANDFDDAIDQFRELLSDIRWSL